MERCYSNLHTSIATSCRRIITWKRQGTLLLDYYDMLMETCHTSSNAYLVALRHRSMEALTQVAARLLRKTGPLWETCSELLLPPYIA